MKSYPSASDVLEELGDKVLESIVNAVDATRADLARYRQTCPDLVARHSPRGLASWIHDCLWHHLATELGEQDRVEIIEKVPPGSWSYTAGTGSEPNATASQEW